MDEFRKELVYQLRGGHAHAPLEQVVKDMPFEKQGVVPKGMPYSAWQLLEHLRLALEDMVEFSDNADGHYREKSFPEGYWPKSAEPPSKNAWAESVKKIEAEMEKFVKLISDPKADLFRPFAWGDGQTLLREAMQIVDHNAYHLGELVAVRRSVGAWES
jgi:hypothetical protein